MEFLSLEVRSHFAYLWWNLNVRPLWPFCAEYIKKVWVVSVIGRWGGQIMLVCMKHEMQIICQSHIVQPDYCWGKKSSITTFAKNCIKRGKKCPHFFWLINYQLCASDASHQISISVLAFDSNTFFYFFSWSWQMNSLKIHQRSRSNPGTFLTIKPLRNVKKPYKFYKPY